MEWSILRDAFAQSNNKPGEQYTNTIELNPFCTVVVVAVFVGWLVRSLANKFPLNFCFIITLHVQKKRDAVQFK